MTIEQIEKFFNDKNTDYSPVQITFKTRPSIKGLFIKNADFRELRNKNLWRIVSGPNIDSYNSSKDSNLARIFSGMEMTRLEKA